MPLFEFKCVDCGAFHEVLQRWNDDAPDCRRCDGLMVKQVSATNFKLNGSGWARDNYGLANKPTD